MNLVEQHNAADYLRGQGWLAPSEQVHVRQLTGGVSNEVLYVTRAAGLPDLVVKQARPQLRTAADWFCSVERIWREIDVLKICGQILERHPAADGQGLQIATPKILYEDRDNYLFVMSAAPADHQTWKQLLLSPSALAADASRQQQIAQACGTLLGRLHAGGWQDATVAAALADRQIFEELRLAPYYRALASAHPDMADHLNALIAATLAERLTLVHADFSPKNLLVADRELMLVDFETGHYGDPAFDLGFFLSHLVLKAFFHAPAHEAMLSLTEAFWRTYKTALGERVAASQYPALVARGIQHFAACMWARLDGVSTIDYLPDEPRRQRVRAAARGVLLTAPASWAETLDVLREKIG